MEKGIGKEKCEEKNELCEIHLNRTWNQENE